MTEEVGKLLMQLENFKWTWKQLMKLESYYWSEKYKCKLESSIEIRTIILLCTKGTKLSNFSFFPTALSNYTYLESFDMMGYWSFSKCIYYFIAACDTDLLLVVVIRLRKFHDEKNEIEMMNFQLHHADIMLCKLSKYINSLLKGFHKLMTIS